MPLKNTIINADYSENRLYVYMSAVYSKLDTYKLWQIYDTHFALRMGNISFI